MKLVPYIVLIPEETAARVDAITDERWNRVPLNTRHNLEELCIQNGWTINMIVAGSLLRGGLDVSQ